MRTNQKKRPEISLVNPKVRKTEVLWGSRKKKPNGLNDEGKKNRSWTFVELASTAESLGLHVGKPPEKQSCGKFV